jgi:hypothetical protein
MCGVLSNEDEGMVDPELTFQMRLLSKQKKVTGQQILKTGEVQLIRVLDHTIETFSTAREEGEFGFQLSVDYVIQGSSSINIV